MNFRAPNPCRLMGQALHKQGFIIQAPGWNVFDARHLQSPSGPSQWTGSPVGGSRADSASRRRRLISFGILRLVGDSAMGDAAKSLPNVDGRPQAETRARASVPIM